MPYAYGRITKLAAALEGAGVPPAAAARILEGGERIGPATKGPAKAAWMRGAMERMDELLDPSTRRCVREACACCLGGKRLLVSRGIARDHATLEDRIAAADRATFVFGHSVAMQDDGRVLVRFSPDGLPEYRCVCLPNAGAPISRTYCQCCGGHAKHHLQIALGLRLECEVRSSALESAGARPCTFLFTIVDGRRPHCAGERTT